MPILFDSSGDALGTFVSFRRHGPEEAKRDRVTSRWTVISLSDSGLLLGLVAWFPQWRKYAFYPLPHVVFEQVCLREIAEFIESSTAAHKEARRHAKNMPPL